VRRIGDYQVEHELAITEHVAIYRAVHQVLPRRVLLKVAREGALNSVAVLREACILAALPHPGIVRVYETGRLPDHRTWFALEIVEGLTLAGTFVLGSPKPEIDPAVAVGMIRDVAEILAHAHQRGVIHCGITPERLVVAGRGRGFPMCITDWSAARAHDAQPSTIGECGPYAAPEVAAGDAVDDRADVFALGVVAYRALTGVLPFDTVAIAADGRTHHVPAEVHCPDAPRELTKLVDQMLAADRWDRPSSAEVRAELGWLAHMMVPPPHPPLPTPEVVRIRKPRWTPQIDFAKRADTESDAAVDDPELPDPSS
jgi:eukaryotic-like serine/threonine-protein kinase